MSLLYLLKTYGFSLPEGTQKKNIYVVVASELPGKDIKSGNILPDKDTIIPEAKNAENWFQTMQSIDPYKVCNIKLRGTQTKPDAL